MKEKSILNMFKGEGAPIASAFNIRQEKDIPEPGRGKLKVDIGRNTF